MLIDLLLDMCERVKTLFLTVEDWKHIRRQMLDSGTPPSVFLISRKTKSVLGFVVRPVTDQSIVALDWYDASRKTAFLLTWCDSITPVNNRNQAKRIYKNYG